MRVLPVVLAALAWLVAAQPRAAPAADGPGPVRVAAASSLRLAFDALVARYGEIRPGARVSPSFGSSGTFFAQLSSGAPFDLFLSADAVHAHRLLESGVALRGSEFTYAVGRLVLWVPNASPLPIETSGLEALLHPAVRRIAIANPAHAPYGAAASAALRRYGVHDRVAGKLVLGDNAAQTAQFAQTGAADAAILPLSLALAPELAGAGRTWLVPEAAHPRLEQVGVRIAASRKPEEARRFAEFLAGPEGRAILARHGFRLPGE